MTSLKSYTKHLAKLFKGRNLESDAKELGITKSKLEAILAGEEQMTSKQAIAIGKLTNSDPAEILHLQTEAELETLGHKTKVAEPKKGMTHKARDLVGSKSSARPEVRRDFGSYVG